MMKQLSISLAALCCLMSSMLLAQQVTEARLRAALPAVDLPGYTRGQPYGEADPDNNWAEASVTYEENLPDDLNPEDSTTIQAIITVTVSNYGLDAATFKALEDLANRKDQERFQYGYERAITVQGKHKGSEEVASEEDYKMCQLKVGVANRFLVIISGDQTDDVKLLYKLLDGMDLTKLERVF